MRASERDLYLECICIGLECFEAQFDWGKFKLVSLQSSSGLPSCQDMLYFILVEAVCIVFGSVSRKRDNGEYIDLMAFPAPMAREGNGGIFIVTRLLILIRDMDGGAELHLIGR